MMELRCQYPNNLQRQVSLCPYFLDADVFAVIWASLVPLIAGYPQVAVLRIEELFRRACAVTAVWFCTGGL